MATKLKMLADSWRRPLYDERTGRITGYNRYRKGAVINFEDDQEAKGYLAVRNMAGNPLFVKNEETKPMEKTNAPSDKPADKPADK